VEGYESEKEQVEIIKRWLQANGKSIIVGVVLGVALVSGGRWWMSNQQHQAELASEIYEQVLQAVQKGDNAAALEKGGRLLQSAESSNYSALTALVLAKLKADQSDLEGARYYLQWVVDHASQAPLKDIARLRLAQVLSAKGDNAGALQTLDAVDAKAFAGQVQELKGDIYLAMGKRDEARKAYSAASAALDKGADHSRLDMKLAEAGAEAKGAP
jgi:predicted negative regulator of RcsB-dependent stress response